MSEHIQPIRGMSDILPAETPGWQAVERVLKNVMRQYGYHEIRIPVVERTELFKRSIGEGTDIVEKEMYTFDDRNNESLTLRPEATAGIVRAGISNSLLYNQKQKLWFTGPMFRYERPQKGRYRQFHQFDVEALGFAGPDIDAEIIVMAARIWAELGIGDVELQLNSLGTSESRQSYRKILHSYFSDHEDQLDEDSLKRLQRNPMRILDSKNPALAELISAAPQITDHLDAESVDHFGILQELLADAGIKPVLNSRLVRGLDYYSRTVFEWVTDKLGAQGAICSGGRYDGLVEHLGGKPTPAIGWGMGLERLVAMVELQQDEALQLVPEIYIVAVGEATLRAGFGLAERLRSEHGFNVEFNCGGGSFKSQFKRADRSGAEVALILGEAELASGEVGLKLLREKSEQVPVSLNEVGAKLESVLVELST
ncbi:MAG: histidine--tRNA ligase [Gammaproteobacteria bacterium]